MTTLLRQSMTAKEGYEIAIIDEYGNEEILPITKRVPNDPLTLILPENPSNRKYFKAKKVDDNGGEIELTYKETRTLGPKGETQPRKPLEDYLSPDEKVLFLELLEKAKKNREEANKRPPMTELEKAKAKMERIMEQIKRLELQEKGE